MFGSINWIISPILIEQANCLAKIGFKFLRLPTTTLNNPIKLTMLNFMVLFKFSLTMLISSDN